MIADVFILTILLPVTVYLDIFIKDRGLMIIPYEFELTFGYEDHSCIPHNFH